MAAVTICSDFRAPKEEICHCFYPSICHEVMRPDVTILVFLYLVLTLVLSLSSFTFVKRLFSSSLLSANRVVSPAHLRLLTFLPPIWIPGCNSCRWNHVQDGWFKMRKEFDRAVCCHPVCLIYVLSTSWEMLGWMSYTGTINAVILGFWFC